MSTKIQLRHSTASEWTAANPTLDVGEVGIESDTHQIKAGDGLTPWNSLPYASSVGSGGGVTNSEDVRDIIGSTLVAGTNISIVVNDVADTITISATGSAGTVNTVNGKTGTVVLVPSDLGIGPATNSAQGLVRLAGDLAGAADSPTLPNTPWIVVHDGVTDPLRPPTSRPVLWVTPDSNRPATNGTTGGGTYAAVNNLDFAWFF